MEEEDIGIRMKTREKEPGRRRLRRSQDKEERGGARKKRERRARKKNDIKSDFLSGFASSFFYCSDESTSCRQSAQQHTHRISDPTQPPCNNTLSQILGNFLFCVRSTFVKGLMSLSKKSLPVKGLCGRCIICLRPSTLL